jgi:hypothetical protein
LSPHHISLTPHFIFSVTIITTHDTTRLSEPDLHATVRSAEEARWVGTGGRTKAAQSIAHPVDMVWTLALASQCCSAGGASQQLFYTNTSP